MYFTFSSTKSSSARLQYLGGRVVVVLILEPGVVVGPRPPPFGLGVDGRLRGWRVVLGGGVKGVQGWVPPTGLRGV